MDRIKKLFHDYFGWGYPINQGKPEWTFRCCKFCSGRIIMDRLGNWNHTYKTKFKVGDRITIKYGGIHKFKIIGVYVNWRGEVTYKFKNWWGWGGSMDEDELDNLILEKIWTTN